MLALLLMLACGPAETPAPEPAEPEAPARVVPEDEAPPPGKIAGEPILPTPVVVGAVSAESVNEGMKPHMTAIQDCYKAERMKAPDLRGKVLVKFTIDADGSVGRSAIKSTSLRHQATESCVNDVVANVTFAPLEGGGKAVVNYPLSFGDL